MRKTQGADGSRSTSDAEVSIRLAVVEPPSLRLALTPAEAADALGVSLDFFNDHIRPELRLIRRGRKVLVPVRSLEVWLERSAARTLERDR